MKERSLISSIGILIYLVISIIDRFFYKIPDVVYIPVAVIGILIIIAGFLIDKKRNR